MRSFLAIRRGTLAAGVLSLLLTGCFGDDLPVVEVQRVGDGKVTQTVSAPATIEAAASQQVAAGVSGVVVDLAVRDGEKVRKGQTVLRLSSEQVQLAREQARAAESAAAGAGGVAVSGAGDQTLANVQEAVAALDRRTEPRVAEARRNAKRIKDADQRAAALSAVDAVEASYEATRAALLTSGQALAAQQDATAEALSSALNQAASSATAAQRLQAEAAAAAAKEQASQLVVKAPFAGRVQLGDAAVSQASPLPGQLPDDLSGAAGALSGLTGGGEPGGTLRVGAPVNLGQVLFSVYDLSERYAAADVDEVDAPQVRSGQRATVLVDAFPEATFEGIVEQVQVAADRTETGGVGYPIRIRIIPENERRGGTSRRLRVGMTASAEIVTKNQQADLVVASRALLRREGGDIVYVVRDSVVEVVDVRVLALGEERAAVRGDLEVDDQVVVTGYEDLSAGDEVTLQ
ncbi:MAG: efflux RND transporter periplasmic adaptor subunit [Actinomycetota bacterium]|nr:efflux RND transporter periplasmic adaptor subunit [Euzebyaceae bacterium]MDQ3452902.1 efflux RND transporter periplasmic adaptor subunit [Actinomycetota bacterium]